MSSSKQFWEEVAKRKGLEREKVPPARKFWSAKSRDLLIPKDSVIIGEDIDTLQKAYLELQAFNTHIHIIGATMTGKSYLMEALLRDLLLKGCGACLIDPHGSLYQHLVNFLGHFPELAKKVIFFNPAENKPFCVGFNPLKKSSYFGDLTVQVKFLTGAAAKVWEEESKKTPLLRRVYGDMLYPLIEGEHTILETEYFVDLENRNTREKLVACTNRRRVLNNWALFEKLSLPRKKDEIGSLQNRIPEFIDNEAVRLTMGRTENVLDFEDIFENQKVLLCNLSQKENRLTKDDSFMLGIMLINDMVNYAKSRTEERGKERPYFLFIDEFQNYLTPDISETLDQCRKFGLHLILAHQRLAQLKEQDPQLYSSVMINARTKVIFSSSWEDLEILEKDVFAGEHNLKEIKDQIYRTAVLDYKEETRTIYGHGESRGDVEGTALSNLSGMTHIPGVDSVDSGKTAYTRSTTRVSSGASSRGSIDQETEVPILIPVLGRELSSRQFYPLEEQRYKNIVALKKQPTQHAFVKVLEEPTQRVRIKTVEPFPEDPRKQGEIEHTSHQHQSRYYLEKPKVKDLIEQRGKSLTEIIHTELKEPASFREPKAPAKTRK